MNVDQKQKTKTLNPLSRLRSSLSKTSQKIGFGLSRLFGGKKIDQELYDSIEEQLLIADVGMQTTQKIMDQLTKIAKQEQMTDSESLYLLLKKQLTTLLESVEQPLNISTSQKPYVILMIGVNGVGKTTTIGKLSKQLQQQGLKVMLAAGDTFRAAAVEQLQSWGARNDIPVIAQHSGADSASVIFDAIESAKARAFDVVIADTAGRLQNKTHLMDELKKIIRVMQKTECGAPHEVMLTLDATTGQNAISQIKLFNEVVPITGLTLSKLDGTAKGGVIFNLADQFNIPVRFIGIGEAVDDLTVFNAANFSNALFNDQATEE